MSRCFFLKPSKTQDFGARCFGDSRGCPYDLENIMKEVYIPPQKKCRTPRLFVHFKLRLKTSVPWSKSTTKNQSSRRSNWRLSIVLKLRRRFVVSSFHQLRSVFQKDNSDVVPKGCRESNRTAHWGPMSFFQNYSVILNCIWIWNIS